MLVLEETISNVRCSYIDKFEELDKEGLGPTETIIREYTPP